MREFIDVLLDAVSIRDNIISLQIERLKNQAVDTLTLELADFSLYASFDFGLVPTVERLHVGTAKGTPKTDGATSASGILTSAGSDFTAEGYAIDDIIHVISSTVAADIGGWPVTAVGTTTITTSHTFGTATGMTFIILTNQGKFFGEKPDVLEDKDQISIPSLWGRNSLAKLTDPFVSKLTKTYANKTTLTAVVLDIVSDAGMDSSKVVIDIDDYIIPGNLLTISQRVPLQVIIDLAAKTNGYVRCTKAGDLHIKKDIFHWGSESIAQALTDNEINEMNEAIDFPEFGNRILVRSVLPESGQDIKLSLSLETGCIRGDGRARAKATVSVTDLRGNPVADGMTVNWTVDDISLFALFPQTLTRQQYVTAEGKRSSSLETVGTDLPIVDVMGVFIKQDVRRQTNFYTGGSYLGRIITLGSLLPFSNSEVIVDYIAGGVSTNTVQSIAGATEGDSTFVNAFVGQIRASRSLCINNSRNVSLSLRTDPSEHNLCLAGAHESVIIAHVRDNGEQGQLIGVNWEEEGPGSLSKAFTIVKDRLLESEFGMSSNLYTVHTQYDIVSVTGVWLAEDGKGSLNLYTTPSHRTGSFSEREIILGTNLISHRERVIIEYVAKSIAVITYFGPTTGTGPDLSIITAKINDGTEKGIEVEEEIQLTYVCPDEDGNIPGYDPVTGLPTMGSGSIKGPDCGASSTEARACDFDSFGLNEQVECICGFLQGGDCPTDEEDCREMCQEDYNSHGFSSLHCESETGDEYCKRETGRPSGDAFDECSENHEEATVDKCTERCMNHSEDAADLAISPGEAEMPCGGSESLVFTAIGGTPPYSWGTSGGEGAPGLVVTGENQDVATLIPPSKTPVAGVAFISRGCCNGTPPANAQAWATFGCEDDLLGCGRGGPETCPGYPEICSCSTPVDCTGAESPCTGSVACLRKCARQLASGPGQGAVTDERTQTMIDNGCLPCSLSMEGMTISVTDAFGQSAVASIEVP